MKLPKVVINGTEVTLNPTGGESRGGKALYVAEVNFPNGDKCYLKHYAGQNGDVRDVTEEVKAEMFDSRTGKVEKKAAKAAGVDRMDKLEAMLAKLLEGAAQKA